MGLLVAPYVRFYIDLRSTTIDLPCFKQGLTMILLHSIRFPRDAPFAPLRLVLSVVCVCWLFWGCFVASLCSVCRRWLVSARWGLVVGCRCWGCSGPWGQDKPRSSCRCLAAARGGCSACGRPFCPGRLSVVRCPRFGG